MIELIQNLTNLQIFLLINNLIISYAACSSIVKSIRIKYKKRFWITSFYYLCIILLNSVVVLGIPIFQTY